MIRLLKKTARWLLNKVGKTIFQKAFFRFFKQYKNEKTLWVVDIDNTFADTWPTLVHWPKSESARYLEMPLLQGMYQKLLKAQSQHIPIVFLTARPYERYFQTIKWLKTNGLNAYLSHVVFVATPAEKADLLEKLPPSVWQQKIVYFDDLSYAQELGPVKFYTETIERVKKLPLEYIGYEDLININNRTIHS